jgi:hypothetical protein
VDAGYGDLDRGGGFNFRKRLIRKPEHCVLPQKSTTSVKGEISHVSLFYFP